MRKKYSVISSRTSIMKFLKVNRISIILFVPVFVFLLYMIASVFGQMQFENELVPIPKNNSFYTKQSIFRPNNRRQNILGKETEFKQLYVSIKNNSSDTAHPNIRINGRDWSSNISIVREALAYNTELNDDQKITRLTEFVYKNIQFQDAPYTSTVPNPRAIHLMNILGYGICSDYSFALATFLEVAGYRTRIQFLDGIDDFKHVVVEVFYSGTWHMLDASYGLYFINNRGNIASLEEVFNHPEWLNSHQKLQNKPGIKDFLKNIYVRKYITKTEYKDTFLSKKVLENFSYALDGGDEIRFYSNWNSARIVDDLKQPIQAITQGFLKASTTFTTQSSERIKHIELPYPVTSLFMIKPFLCLSASHISVSIDGGPWMNTQNYCQNDRITITPLLPNGKNVNIFKKYTIKIDQPNLHAQFMTIYAQFEVASVSIPRLRDGINTIDSINSSDLDVKFVFVKN